MAKARAWLEIDPATLVANARALARKAAPASLCAVVKSNAYGHGMLPVAHALASAGIEGLRVGVFRADEGLALRSAGIREPILVLGPVAVADLETAARARLELGLLDEDLIEPFARAGIRAHVKIDTGTSRFGIPLALAAQALRRCGELGLEVAGIYSHLANAEDLDKPFTLLQLQRLKDVAVEFIRPPGGGAHGRVNSTAPLLHIAASAATLMWPETRLDMVRCGIALYGVWPSAPVEAVMAGEDPSFELRPALRWFAPIVQLRDVAAGDSVGYGRAFVAQRDTRIAVLPLGYADGLPRAAGNGRLHVRLRDGRAPVVGRICMNACMLDVTDVPQPALGDTAELGIDDVARAAGTINYEILAALPEHVERRYR